MDNDKNTSKNTNHILDKTRSMASDLMRVIYDININNYDIEDEINSLDVQLMSTIKSIEDDTNGSIATLIQRFNADNKHEKEFIDSFDRMLKEGQDLNFIKNLYGDFHNHQNYVDFESIKTFIPDLKEALIDLKNSIISPDDFTSSISDYITYKDTSKDAENVKQLIDSMNEKYDIETKFENLIEESLQRGRYYIFIKPYEEIFKELLAKKNENGGKISESFEINIDDFIKEYDKEKNSTLSESVYNKFETLTSNKTQREDVSELAKDILSNVDIMDNNITLNCINEIKSKVDIMSEIKGEKTIKDTIKNINIDNLQSSDGFVNANSNSNKDNNSKIKDIGLDGVYLELIEPQFIIPVKVNKSVLGYYYIEASEDLTTLNNMNKASFLNPNASINKNLNNNLGSNLDSDNFFNSMSEFIIQKLDKKFIKDNKDLKTEIYDIIRYNDNYKRNMKISFIEKEYMEEIEVNDGKGIFHYSLTLSKIYISVLLTYVMLKISRSKDEMIHYVKQSSIDSDISNSVNSAIRSIQRKSWDMKDLLTGSVDRLFRLGNGGFSKHFIPVSKSNEKPIDIEVLSGQDTSINDDLLEQLLTLIRNSTGVPSVILNYANEADYAKTLAMANAKYVRVIMGYQRLYKRSLTRIYRKIMRYETIYDDSYKELDVNLFKVELPPPRTLMANITLDTFSLYDGKLTSMLRTQFGESGDESEIEIKDEIYRDMMKYYTPNEDWDIFDEFRKRAEMAVLGRANKDEEINTSKF